MNLQPELFAKLKQCKICGRRLPESYENDVCPSCSSAELLREVKDFIRENVVNEYQVAEHFGIPVKMVKNWIREGRIEYRTKDDTTISGMHCQRCGATVTFGTLCPACLKLLNSNKGYGTTTSTGEANRMRFLDSDS